MEKQENSILKLRQPLSMLRVIRDTVNTIVRNKVPLQVILCLVMLTNTQLQVETRCDSKPLLKDFPFQIAYGRGDKGVNMRKDVTRTTHEELMIKFKILFTPCCLFLYFAVTTISCSTESYAGYTLSITDAFFKPFRNWKGPLITSSCLLLLTMGIYVVNIISFAVISFFAGRSHVSSSLLYIAVVKWIFNAHVGGLWMMSLVVTVLEDNISGLKAIYRARDLLIGKRIHTSLLMMLYYGVCLLVRKYFDAFFLIFEEWVFEEMWGIKIPFVTGFDVFWFVFYTVLYHECKMDVKVDESGDPSDGISDKSS